MIMNDPTYVPEEITSNPSWKLAFLMSEIDNDNAPVGWGRYIRIANGLLDNLPALKSIMGTES